MQGAFPRCLLALPLLAAFAEAQSIDPHFPFGTWEQTVKDASTTERDDVESTVEALLATGQRFHVYGIDTETEWLDFQLLLDATSSERIDLYASIGTPGLAYEQNRWFDTDGDGVIGDTPPVDACVDTFGLTEETWRCRRDFMRLWIEAWKRAASELSVLAHEYPNLKGLVIDDFMDWIESVDEPANVVGKRVTRDEIAEIQAAARSADSDFGLYPAIHWADVGRFIAPGYVLGVNYGVRLRAGDSMSVAFDIPLLPDPPSARIRFFQAAVGNDSAPLVRTVRVTEEGKSPVEVWSRRLVVEGQPTVELTELPIDLSTGDNLVELELDAVANTMTGCMTSPFWYVWDVVVEYDLFTGGEWKTFEFPLAPRFETSEDPRRYHVQCGGAWFEEHVSIDNTQLRSDWTASLPDDLFHGRAARRLISAPNTPYLIQDVISGVLPYHVDTSFRGSGDAVHPDGALRELLVSTKGHLGGTALIPTQTVLSTWHQVDLDVVVARLTLAAELADAACVYRFPLGMVFMDPSDRRGIFAQQTAPDRVDFRAQWFSRQSLLPGWYQGWVHEPAGSIAELRVVVSDNRSPEAVAPWLSKYVGGGALVAPYVGYPWLDGTSPVVVPDAGVLVSTRADPALFGMSAAAGQSSFVRTDFVVDDRSGAELVPEQWRFESGVDDPHTVAVFERVRDFFLRARGL